jgi:hypothetical protein
MRATFFGVLAVFAVGCSSGPSIDSKSSANDIRLGPCVGVQCGATDIHLGPCVGVQCGAHDYSLYWKLDPADLAEEWGRPELAPDIAKLVAPVKEQISNAPSFNHAQAAVEQFYTQLDQLAAAH